MPDRTRALQPPFSRTVARVGALSRVPKVRRYQVAGGLSLALGAFYVGSSTFYFGIALRRYGTEISYDGELGLAMVVVGIAFMTAGILSFRRARRLAIATSKS